MDINVLYTQQVQTGGKNTPGGPQSATGGQGVFAAIAPGSSFADLIFARLLATQQAGDNKKEGSAANADIDLSALSDTDIIPAHVVLDSSVLDSNTVQQTAVPVDMIDAIETAAAQSSCPDQTGCENRHKKLMDILASLLQGQPQENGAKTVVISSKQIEKLVQDVAPDFSMTIDNKTSSEALPALIATGKSPADLASIIEQLQTQDDTTPEQGYMLVLVQILPPQAKREAVFLPRGTIASAAASPTPAPTAAGDQTSETATEDGDLAARLNSLVIGEDGGSEDPLSSRSFDKILKVLEQAQQEISGRMPNTSGAEKMATTTQKTGAGLSSFQQAVQNGTSSDLLMDASFWQSIYPDGLPWATEQASATAGTLTLNGPAGLTSMAMHAGQAGAPHPATQLVAATLQKASGNGESKTLTLQLDPPDLGRVEIRMKLGNDKTMKTHMVIEKPETYMMLQRDSHVLERALQNAGIDADGSSLSFELAQDGNLFHQGGDGGHNGEAYGGHGNGAGDDSETLMIEATVDWYTDPETGLTRYDFVV
ncbi:MAG: flagellar hook-length control protein FliK [Rhodospirillales bacterium]|nr:flagellar hook-length control protein FliK [Rhodospirillales bacterium]